MSKPVFDVVLLSGSTHVIEADEFYPDAAGRSVVFAIGGEHIAQFFGVESAVKRPATPDPVPPQFLCASAVSELGAVDFPPSVSIGAINITGGSVDEVRAALASILSEVCSLQSSGR